MSEVENVSNSAELINQELQKQIEQLVEEKNKANEKTENMKKKVKEYEARLAQRSKNVSVQNLENTIVALQEQLSKKQADENTKEQYSKVIVGLQESVKKLEKEKNELVEKTKVIEEKESEIKRLTAEKNSVITSLQNMEKRNENLDRIRDSQIFQSTQQLEQTKTNSENKLNEILRNTKKSIDEIRDECDRKISSNEYKYKKQIEELEKDHKKQIETLVVENANKTRLNAHNIGKEIEEYKKTIASLEKELENANKGGVSISTKKDEEIKKIQDENILKLRQKEHLINDLKLKIEKIEGESQETVFRLQEQLNHAKEAVKKMQINAQALNNQFVSNLSKQKELAEKEIISRDNIISSLQTQVKKSVDDSSEKFTAMEQKIRTVSTEYNSLLEAYNGAKLLAENYEQIINALKQENENLRDSFENDRENKFKYTLTEEKLRSELQKKTLENENLSRMNDENKVKLINLTVITNQQQINLKNSLYTIEKYEKTIKQKTLDCEKLMQDYANIISELNRLKQSYPTELQARLQDQKNTINKEIKNLEAKLANAEIVIATQEKAKNELQRELNNIIAEKNSYKVIAENCPDKDNQIFKSGKQISTLEESIRDKDKQVQHYELKIQALLDRQRVDRETILAKSEEVESLKQKIEMMNLSIEKNKANFEQAIKNLVEKHKASFDVLASRESQIVELSKKVRALSSMAPTIERAKRQMAQDMKKVNDGCNAKLAEAEKQLLNADQTIKKLREEFQKQLYDAKQVPIETSRKLSETETENLKLKGKLEMNEAKYGHLSSEYNNLVVSVKTKQQEIKSKELELRLLQDSIKNTPPKLLDPEIRKEKDTALSNLRLCQVELSKAKESINVLNSKLLNTEKMLQDLLKEKQELVREQSQLKTAYAETLNQLKLNYQKEIYDKNQKIELLEKNQK